MTVAILALGPSFWVLVGCSSDKEKWLGEWEGDLHIAAPDAPSDDIKATINRIRITVRPDGTFEMVSSGTPSSGTCRFGDETTFLRVTKRMGRPISEFGQGTQAANRDMTLAWQSDGSVLLTDPKAFDPEPVRLVKRPQR